MTIFAFDDVGSIGVIKDIAAEDLPEVAWSDAQNIRFYDDGVEKFRGSTSIYETLQTSPYWTQPVVTGDGYFWLYAGLNKVYGTDGTTHADLSGTSSLSASADLGWNGGLLGGGLLVINNGKNPPQLWGSAGTPPSLGTTLKDLPNWPASTYCRVMRAYREYLVAMDITEGGVRDRTMVWWSHPAEPLNYPSSWDYADPETDSGRYPLAVDKGYIVDGKAMRDSFMIYKENSLWGMQWVGGSSIMRFFRIFDQAGMMSEDCVVDVFGRHVVLGLGDLYMHDGQQAESIINKRLRKWLFAHIDTTYFRRSFLALNTEYNEVWICYVSTGTTNADTNLIQPNAALVWNWKQNTFSHRDLPNVPFMSSGIASGLAAATFDADAGTFDDAPDTWEDLTFSPQRDRLIACAPGSDPRLLQMDYGDLEDTATMTCIVQRKGLPLGRQGRDGGMRVDLERVKFVQKIYPRITGTDGGVVQVYVGFADSIDAEPTWSGPYNYTIGSSRFINVLKRGRIVSLKVQSAANLWWRLTGYTLDARIEGRR